MFQFLKNNPKGKTAILTISGMHCISCSLNIDGELEDSPGVIEARTNFAKATTTVEYDPKKITIEKIKKIISNLGYVVRE